jgi:hypothetical protein
MQIDLGNGKHVELSTANGRFLAEPLRMLIGGKWVAAKSGKTFDVEIRAPGR